MDEAALKELIRAAVALNVKGKGAEKTARKGGERHGQKMTVKR